MKTDPRDHLASRKEVRERAKAHWSRSSIDAAAAGLFLLCSLIVSPLQAQRTAADSLAERLRQAEAAIAALQAQMSEQAQAGARSRSGARLEFTGRVMVKAFGNNRRVNNVDNPQFVLVDPDPASGVPSRGIGMAIRESRLGLRVDVSEVLGGAFTGDVDADFYGGQVPSSGGRTFPLARLRTARGIIRWTNAELLIGQESPLVSGLNPQTLSAVGTPAFATAGNLWLWLPQLRVGASTGGSVRLGVQGAVLAPTSGDAAASFDTDYDLAERTSRPFVELRASARWGEGDMTRDLGCGVHQGWLMAGATRIDSRAFACDALLPLTEQLELRGEYFTGEALRGLGGGGIGQNFTSATSGLATTGGWAQLNARLGLSQTGLGCGVDHPDALAARRRNESCAAHLTVRPSGPLFVGAELRRIRTAYASSRYVNDHVTFAAGFEF
jgi:hypothetical protein